MRKGQTSTEAFLIIATVLIIVSAIYVRTINANETDLAVSAARKGVQNAISRLTTQYGDEIDIERWDIKNDNIIFYLSVSGTPPPDEATIKKEATAAAIDQLNSTIGGNYTAGIKINRVTR